MAGNSELNAILDRLLPKTDRRPATDADFKRMEVVAPLPAELRRLYQIDAELFLDGFELFEPAIYEDVNLDRTPFGELAQMVFFADDQSDGFFFLDPSDLLGLGAGFVYWVDRGMMAADEVVPLAQTLVEFLAALEQGIDPPMLPTLGKRALERFYAALADLPHGVDANPPLDRAEFQRVAEERGLQITFATGEVLLIANGLYFSKFDRQIHPLNQMISTADGAVTVVGHDPVLGYLGVTRGGWQDVPADRLIAFKDFDHPEHGQILGRFVDVLTYWIEEARAQ